MNHPHIAKASSIRAATVRERFSRSLTVAALTVMAAFVSNAPAEECGKRDCFITVRVRQVLLREPALAPYNLGVSVRDGIATLYGSVPSAALARLAREKVAKVPGVLAVRSELEIRALDDPLVEFLQQLSSGLAPLPDFPSHERYPPPGWLTSRWSEGEKVPAPSSGVSLMPPVTWQPAPTAPISTDLAQAVERVKAQDRRFRQLRATIRDGIVRVSGTAERREDVMEFAREISQLPGVSRVIIQKIQTEN